MNVTVDVGVADGEREAVGVGVGETLGVGKDVELAEGEPDGARLAGDAQAAARMSNKAAARNLTNFRTFFSF